MLFSVLIANYNNGRYINDAINSVIRQTHSQWEIIIVDDASTDNSIDKIERHQENGINIKLFKHNKNEGCGATKSDCVKLSNGDVCGFLDPDDTLEDDALEIMIKEHTNHSDASLIYSTYNCCDNNLAFNNVSDWVTAIPDGTTNLHTDYISHFVSFKREMYFQTEGINREITSAVDKDLYYKLEEVGKVKFIPAPLYNYRENESGVSQSTNVPGALENHLNVIRAAVRRRKKSNFLNLSSFEVRNKCSTILIEMASLMVEKRKSNLAAFRYLAISFMHNPLHHHCQRLRVLLNLARNSVTS